MDEVPRMGRPGWARRHFPAGSNGSRAKGVSHRPSRSLGTNPIEETISESLKNTMSILQDRDRACTATAGRPTRFFTISVMLAVVLMTGNFVFANSPQPAKEHRVVILIDSDNEKIMGHAISYSLNISQSYARKNEKVKIEIVANGSGIKLFRADISPLQQLLAVLRQSIPDVVYSMCDSSRQIAEHKEGHPIALILGARLVPFGIGRVVELQESGWSYVHG
jgi:intracellular sulfur oxidation DsrE/DsrF family protein